ncbi:MAG: TRAP transporter substrate-binding protein [Bernardetiaceae bacterium]|jgi:tripartite ATP-independent transporter DctP family solute receptor|nr:TRAP transporter substrate-binding protein [Bernardetiaceae bacterium]
MKKLLLLFLLPLAACQQLGQTRVLKIAHTHDATHPIHEALVFMGQQLAQKSGGKMTLKIFTSAQLGQEREAVELLQIGSLAMTKVSASALENFVPHFKAFSYPYLFRDRAHQFAVLDGPTGRQMLASTEPYFLRGLGFFDAGSRSFYTKAKPISAPNDLKGMKIRVMKSNIAMQMVEAMGGSPTPISYGELYTALQQGVVDGAENNAPSLLSSRHYEVCKYFSIDEHTTVPDVLLMSAVIWNSLSDQEQAWLQAAADQAVDFQRELWAKAEKEALAQVEKAGVQVSYPAKTGFSQQVEKMYAQVKTENPQLYQLIQAIRQAQ